MNRFAVIADDLTGANENGLHFIRNGLKAQALIYQKGKFRQDLRKTKNDGGILLVDSESRQMTPSGAGRRTAEIAGALFRAGAERIYLKFDSTLRGNIGASLGAALAKRGGEYAAVCMAFPQAGRTTKNGEQFVGGEKVAATEYAKDPLNPVKSSKISRVLREGTRLKTALISLGTLRAGAGAARLEMEKNIAKGARILIFDCVTDADLKAIAGIIDDCRIICGASALSKELAGKTGRKISCPSPERRRVAGIVGSLNRITAGQLRNLAIRKSVRCILVTAEEAVSGKMKADTGKKDFVIVLRGGKSTRASIAALIREKGAAAAAELISRGLARIAKNCGGDPAKDSFFFTGGATAAGACLEFKMRGFRIEGEASFGIPLLRSLPGNTPVVTKSGGFGGKEALSEVMACLKGGKSRRRKTK